MQRYGESVRDCLDQWFAKAEGKCAIDYAFHQIIGGVDGQSLKAMYALVTEGRLWTVASGVAAFYYRVAVDRVVDIDEALTIGAVTSGATTQPGQRAVYSFGLTEARQLLMDALAPNNNVPDFRWTLTGPRGVEVSGRQLYYSESHELGGTNPLLNLIAGDYTLVIDPINDQQGAFSFRLLDVAGAIESAITVPFLHLADATAAAVRAAGVERVGLLGTRYTMEEDFYRSRLESHGLTVLVPDEPDRTVVHDVIFDELVRGIVSAASRERYVAIIDRLVGRGAGGVIAGCTEIELLVRADDPVPSADALFMSSARTFRQLKSNEFRLAEPYKLRIVPAPAGMTIEQVAARSPLKEYSLEQHRLINGLYPDKEPKTGDPVKFVQ